MQQVDIYLNSGSVISVNAGNVNAINDFVKKWNDNRQDPKYVIEKDKGSLWDQHVWCRAVDVIAIVVTN